MRLSSMTWVLVIVVAASLLYGMKYRVQEMEEEVMQLRAELAAEKEAYHVLTAEWAFLTRPERLRTLAKRHIKDLEPLRGQQMTEVAQLPFPADGPIRVVDGEYGFGGGAVPVPRMRPGVHKAGGAAYVR